MKRNNFLSFIGLLIAIVSVVSCKKFEAPTAPMTAINVGSTDSYASVPENSMLTIPIKYTSTCDSGIASAVYKVVNNRANDITLVQSPGVPISFNGKVIDTTIKVPV